MPEADPGASVDPLAAFAALELRIGRVVDARPNERARKPAWVLRLDLGDLGERTSSAQLVSNYGPEDLVGRQVVCVVNLGSRGVAGVRSEVLVLGVDDEDGGVVVLGPERPVPEGRRVH